MIKNIDKLYPLGYSVGHQINSVWRENIVSVITYIKNKNKPEKIDFEEGVKIFCALSLYVGLPAVVLGYGYYTHTQITKFYETGELNEEDATPLIKRLTEFCFKNFMIPLFSVPFV